MTEAGADSALEEWRMAVTTAQHFNDLLMRLRAFGLPLIATVTGAGFALGLDVELQDVERWVRAALVTANVPIVSALVIVLMAREGWGHAPERARSFPIPGGLGPSEKAMWGLVVCVAWAWCVVFWILVGTGDIDLAQAETYSAAPLVLIFALAVLVVLYGLDRFYYYKLLLGAVNRAIKLEEQLRFRLTHMITDITAPGQSATIVTVLYFLPGTTAYMLLLALLVLNPQVG